MGGGNEVNTNFPIDGADSGASGGGDSEVSKRLFEDAMPSTTDSKTTESTSSGSLDSSAATARSEQQTEQADTTDNRLDAGKEADERFNNLDADGHRSGAEALSTSMSQKLDNLSKADIPKDASEPIKLDDKGVPESFKEWKDWHAGRHGAGSEGAALVASLGTAKFSSDLEKSSIATA